MSISMHARSARPPASAPATFCSTVQGLGTKFARSVKVKLDDMRQKQFDAASVVLRRQLHFLSTGELPKPGGASDEKLAPLGDPDPECRLDKTSAAILKLPEIEGDADVPGKPGQLRLRRTVTWQRGAARRAESRTWLLTSRNDIIELNSLCEKWVRFRHPGQGSVDGPECSAKVIQLVHAYVASPRLDGMPVLAVSCE